MSEVVRATAALVPWPITTVRTSGRPQRSSSAASRAESSGWWLAACLW